MHYQGLLPCFGILWCLLPAMWSCLASYNAMTAKANQPQQDLLDVLHLLTIPVPLSPFYFCQSYRAPDAGFSCIYVVMSSSFIDTRNPGGA
ncbi:hypothetical protein FKM82_009340 [Ascaphus truei]